MSLGPGLWGQSGTSKEKCTLCRLSHPHRVMLTLGRDIKGRGLGSRPWACDLDLPGPTAWSLYNYGPGLRPPAQPGTGSPSTSWPSSRAASAPDPCNWPSPESSEANGFWVSILSLKCLPCLEFQALPRDRHMGDVAEGFNLRCERPTEAQKTRQGRWAMEEGCHVQEGSHVHTSGEAC